MSDMPAPNEKGKSIPRDVLQPPFDQALRLGLRPYAEFEKKMSPLFRRIAPDERERFLRDTYSFAAEKVLMENGRTDTENRAREFAEEAEKVRSAASHIGAASQSLSTAADTLPQDFQGRLEVEVLGSQLHDIMQQLTDKAHDLARYSNALRNLDGVDVAVRSASPSSLQYAIPLRKMDEVAPDLPSGEQLLDSYIRALAGPAASAPFRFCLPAGRKLTSIDHWLIRAIHEYLPKASPGKRLRFSRDAVICSTFEAALGEQLRTLDGIKSARRRKPKRSP